MHTLSGTSAPQGALGPATLTARTLANASQSCPIPAVSTILRLAALGLELATEFEAANDSSRHLCRHAGEVALVVASAFQNMNDTLPNEVLHALDDLQQSIEAINQSIGRVGQLGRLAKAIQRIAIINEVKGLRQDLEAALQAFQLAMTIHTSKRLHEAALRAAKSSTQVLGELEVSANELSASRSSINSEAPWRALPAAPDVLFGRDTELNSVVHLLCKDSADGATCVVLGTGGVGKTSLVLAVLHNERVAALYPSRRLFVSCEGAADSSGVIGALAAGLGLAGEMLRVRVLHALSVAPCLVVLDNLESPWEPQTSRTSVEALVAAIAVIPSAALVVTMRGAERPSGTQWTTPHLPILQPFDRLAAMQTLYHCVPSLAEADDARLHTLLDFLGDLPLAVSIVAGMLHFESADELLVRWQTERTGMIDMGEHTKLSSLNLSIQISLHSQRMRAFPSAELLLMAISLFPDGIVDTEDGIAFLKPALPRLRQHLSVLKQASLAYTNSVGRICVLPPIREFMLRRQDLPDAFIQALVEFCLGFSVPLQDYVRDAPELHAVMLPEMQNMQSVMGFLFEAQREEAVPVLSIIRAFDLYGSGRGMDNEPLLQHALVLARSLNRVEYQVDLLVRLSSKSRDQALRRAYATDALELAHQYGDKVREAAAHFNAAAAWILSESPVEARRHLESALSVVEDEEPTDEVISLRAYTCRFLAEVHNTHFDRDGLAVAVDYMRRAQDLYTQLRHESGLNSCYIFLAQCALERCAYKESEQTAQNVLKYALQTQNIIHEAAATSVLAETASRRGDYTAAISFIQRYSKIFWQVGNMAPFIWALKTEATFEMERNRLERAEEILKTAFKEVKGHGMEDSLPATQCYKMRGTLRAKQGEFLAACADLGQAILMARRMTIESSEEAYCLTEMAKLLNLHGDGQAALIPAISAMASFRKNGDLSSLLDCMLELGVSFALGRDGKSAWNCWSVALDCHLRSGAAHDAGVCLLSMVKLQATTPIEFLPTVVNRIPASQRLNAAFALFEANKDEAGLQRSIELARTLGLPDPPDDLP